ncbi:MAG: homoserine dehydrogenase, partial [Deltaproteobacteria bacterium]|nr:homoserine dehydrogenase [Deltaproteobacteria bacterium]
LTTQVREIINDPSIDLVVELIGGFEPAKTIILDAFKKGKHVITANKALLAGHGVELLEAAHKRKVDIGCEGSVAGGIPIIRAIKEGLSANNIRFILGILNGTANYILSKMTNEGGKFKDILREAKQQGYAESDPTLDIEGLDTAHKLAILINMAYGTKITFKDVYTEGISHIEPIDIEFARELGYRIKLLAISRQLDPQVEARVHPTLIPVSHLLSKVDGTYNAIFIDGDAVGPSMFYGKGAGMMPAASGVVSDIIDISRNIVGGISQRVPPFSYQMEFLKKARIKNIKEVVTRYYLRFSVVDCPGVLSKISGILGKNNISIHSVIQKGRRIKGVVPIFLLTHEAREADVRKALKEIDRLPITNDKTMLIRIEDQI